EQVLPDSIRVLGEDHPDTLAYRNNLAHAYESAGRLEEAITLYEQVLPDSIRVLGKNHPDTLATLNALARAYKDAGFQNKATALLEGDTPTEG
ncbi:MAG: tetratricopeptide repeat protein, partial [Actinomyces graevenitzii]|nr:tetratricopeptide repeat protein [Actinomyces graevenitzii]